LAFYFGDICYSEFSRKRSFLSDLGFGLKRACIPPRAILEEERARLGHPAREVLERDGESGKRTLLLASKFIETPGCNVTLPNSRLGQNLERRHKFNIAVQPVTSTHGTLRDPNPVLHGVPFGVIPDQQVLLRAVRALDLALQGRIQNNSQYTVTGVRFFVQIVAVGAKQDSAVLDLKMDILPGEAQTFRQQCQLSPPPGKWGWDYEALAIEAAPNDYTTWEASH
jgi:hypothetical protein